MSMKRLGLVWILAAWLAVEGCNLVPPSDGQQHVYHGQGITIYYPVSIRAVSPYEIRLSMADGQYQPQMMDISNFQVAMGGMKLLGISPDMGYEVALYVSNQVVGQDYGITIKDIGFTNITNYHFIEITNIISNKNKPGTKKITNTVTNDYYLTNQTVWYLQGDTLYFPSWGSDDKQIPSLRLLYPATNHIKHNIYVQGPSLHFRAFASDDVGIDRIEYKVDSKPYHLAAQDDFAAVNVALESFAEGTHSLVVRASDLMGNTTSCMFKFDLDRTVPTIWVRAKNDPYVFNTNNSIELQAYSSDSSLVNFDLAINTPTTNYNWQAMTRLDANNYKLLFAPRLRDSGRVEVIFRSENGVGFIQYITNTFLLYEGTAIYVSQNGSDENNGTINDPLANINPAMGLAISLGITNLFVSEGIYSAFTLKSNIKIEGGYSTDFSIHTPLNFNDQYNMMKTVIVEKPEINALPVTSMFLKDLYFNQGLEIYNSRSSCLENLDCINSSGDALFLNISRNNIIKNSYFHNSLRGIEIIGDSNQIISSQIKFNIRELNYKKDFFTTTSFLDTETHGGGALINGNYCQISNCIISDNTIKYYIEKPGLIPAFFVFLTYSEYLPFLYTGAYGAGLSIGAHNTITIYDTVICNNVSQAYGVYYRGVSILIGVAWPKLFLGDYTKILCIPGIERGYKPNVYYQVTTWNYHETATVHLYNVVEQPNYIRTINEDLWK